MMSTLVALFLSRNNHELSQRDYVDMLYFTSQFCMVFYVTVLTIFVCRDIRCHDVTFHVTTVVCRDISHDFVCHDITYSDFNNFGTSF